METTQTETVETVYDIQGNKCGVIVRYGYHDYEAFNLSDVSVYRGKDYLLAAWMLQDRD